MFTKPMSEEEILKYRSSGIPAEILDLMEAVKVIASNLDMCGSETTAGQLRIELKETLTHTEQRVRFYYKRRQEQFGIHNMTLKRIIDTFPDLYAQWGFIPPSVPR